MCCGTTGGAVAPVNNFGFVDFESVVVIGSQTRHLAGCTVDVEHHPAAPADQVMVVVTDAVLIASCRASGLDPANQVLVDQDAERVIDRLAGDGAELGAHFVAQLVGSGMGMFCDDAHEREPLSSDLYAVLAQEFHCCFGHDTIRPPILDFVKNQLLLGWTLGSPNGKNTNPAPS